MRSSRPSTLATGGDEQDRADQAAEHHGGDGGDRCQRRLGERVEAMDGRRSRRPEK